MQVVFRTCFLVIVLISSTQCRHHTLTLKSDPRTNILCSQFAYGSNGYLGVQLKDLSVENMGMIGFTLEKTTANSIGQSSRSATSPCMLDPLSDKHVIRILLTKMSGEITNQAGAAIEVASEKSFIKFFNSDGGLNPDLLKTAIAHFFSLYLPPNDRSNVPQMSIEIIKKIREDEILREQVKGIIDVNESSDNTVNAILQLMASYTTPNNELRRSRRAADSDLNNTQSSQVDDAVTPKPQAASTSPENENDQSRKQPANDTKVHEKMLNNNPLANNSDSLNKPADKDERQNSLVKQPEVNQTAESKRKDEELPKSLLEPAVLAAISRASSEFNIQNSPNSFPYTLNGEKASLNFTVNFTEPSVAGAYDLVFHNCLNRVVDISITMVEMNGDNYLSLGEKPLALLFGTVSIIYFVLSIIWGLHLKLSKAPVLRIHYLMLAMVVVKSASLCFHAINYYVIGKHGVQEEGWVVMYYITHMIRGFLFFVTILMIGAGWTLIKHVFTPREKHIFLVVIPLQVFANIATIVINETELGNTRFHTWNQIFVVVDLLCCAAVLFPVIWSIRHLQQAAQSDGKVAQNLRKLRLFRHFYIMVICYIYFTRIIVYLLKMTTPFSLSWLVELFEQMATLVFLTSVGVKFRPFNDNPYLQLPTDEAEDILMDRFEMDEAHLQSGFTDGITRVNRPQAVDVARDNRRRRNDLLNRPTGTGADNSSDTPGVEDGAFDGDYDNRADDQKPLIWK